MLVDRSKTRSKSHKRKNTVSVEHDENLIKILHEKAQLHTKVLISLSEFNDLKDRKKTAEQLKDDFDRERKVWITKINSIKSTKNFLIQENQDLRIRISELEGNSQLTQEDSLKNIKQALTHLESVVSQRAEHGKKLLLKIHKLLAKHAKLLLECSFPQSTRSRLTDGIKKISEAASSIEKLLVGQAPDRESPEFYKAALENMKNQTVLLREKLKELEGADGLKKVIEEQEGKIETLQKEKENLQLEVYKLRGSIKDQERVIEEIKNYSRRSDQYSAKSSPGRTKGVELDERDLQFEIANLDSEIQQLQCSLKRVWISG